MENSLYPLKFHTIFKDKIWGGNKIKELFGKDYSPLPNCGETWEISGVEGNISIVKNGFLEGNDLQELIEIYMGELVGEKVYEKHGLEFPVLIKFIDAADYLSIQVHPDDKLAKKRHQMNGKNEMWYIFHAEQNAEVIAGFNKEVTKEEYLAHLENKTLKSILNIEKVKEGDVFFMPAGRVHALGPGICLAEIQQTSDITYRIYDWDRKDAEGNSRELHTELALDAIDFNKYPEYKTKYETKVNEAVNIGECPYFTTNLLQINQKTEKDYSHLDSFVIYICTEGSFEIHYNEYEYEPVSKGECVLIPAELKDITLIPSEESKILEVFIQ